MLQKAKDGYGRLLQVVAYAVAYSLVLLAGLAKQAQAAVTPIDYTGKFNDAFTKMNIAGDETSLLSVLSDKAYGIMTVVIGLVVVASIVWRLSRKSTKMAG